MKIKLQASAIICLLTTTTAFATLKVAITDGVLYISSSITEGNQKVIAKIVAPNDQLIVDKTYEGSSFTWTPSAGANGAYRYDVRVITTPENESSEVETKKLQNNKFNSSEEYAGGSIVVVNGKIEEPHKAPKNKEE